MTKDPAALSKLRLEELLAFFGVNGKVKVDEVEAGTLELSVDTDPTGKLIGHHGENLRALQYILNMIVRNQSEERVFCSVDIADYKKGRAEQLSIQAQQAAEKVIETGETRELAPMNAAERRIVHMALAEMPGVVTESAGEEPRRYIIIKKAE